jgi:hypothetical protein
MTSDYLRLMPILANPFTLYSFTSRVPAWQGTHGSGSVFPFPVPALSLRRAIKPTNPGNENIGIQATKNSNKGIAEVAASVK